jgi:D-alanyl-D-alanine carboxypeptidase
MRRVASEPSYRLREFVFGAVAVGTVLAVSSAPVDARYHRYYARHTTAATHPYRHQHAESYSPPTSAIVVDGNTGSVLHAANADGLRHPASLTKIMTLYLLFERLEAGKIRLDTPLRISEHAAEQSPTKLGVRPGQSLAVEDAIKAVVTKSANDAAVAIAENLGGNEPDFAKLMTAKAHALGMSRTTYVNASGLPDDDQITTAQDQALLGRAIQERFPHYYKYFSTEEFVYHGHAMRNHNHLLGVVGGVDGIKTGYTTASGFNLVASVHRDGRYIVAVVLGGRSAGERDAHMRELISTYIKEASLRHTAPAIAERTDIRVEPRPQISERSEQRGEPKPLALAKTPSRADPATTGKLNSTASATSDPIQPLLVKTITYRTAPVQAAPLAPMPALLPAAAPAQTSAAAARSLPVPQPPAPAPAPAAPPAAAAMPLPVPPPPPAPAVAPPTPVRAADSATTVVVAASEPAVIAPSSRIEAPARTIIAKTEPVQPEAAKPEPVKAASARPEIVKPEIVRPEIVKPEVNKPEIAKLEIAKPEPRPAQVHARGGWVIQIGAFEAEEEAKQHLSEARLKMPSLLASADPFTERVQKGDKALYRARFAGFDKAMAEAACKQLKRSDIACLTVKN